MTSSRDNIAQLEHHHNPLLAQTRAPAHISSSDGRRDPTYGCRCPTLESLAPIVLSRADDRKGNSERPTR